ncbi:hypothetical protein [Longimicrobium sp.]|uniref:hypothetical protein n=1 Tax=Longimicrobium sp. TaxID=2029185 RepID=UPI002CA5B080|nr:hypothetical protein [Longimicrobium sp.]HSU15410.1 hypothetical protein [Longimicrobium sp.]
MNKLKLDVDTLRVDQFKVEGAAAVAQGTVLANSDTLTYTTYPIRYCPNMPASSRC